MRTGRLAAAACLALVTVLSGCSLNAAGDAATRSAGSSGAPSSDHSFPVNDPGPAFGRTYTFPSGVAVAVAPPRAFTPSKTAYPRSAHAVSFEITIVNGSEASYRLSDIVITATVNGEPSEEIIDSTQGYTGLADASTDIPASRRVRLLLAFSSPTEPATTSLNIRPSSNEGTSADFIGDVAR